MHKLENSYGKCTFDAWHTSAERHGDPDARSKDLRFSRTDTAAADRNLWPVESFRELVERVAFLGSMNKRMTLLYRGQRRDVAPAPVIARDTWTCFGSDEEIGISGAREHYWKELAWVGRRVYEICRSDGFGLPRWRGIRDTREVQWAVIQHYGLWPTPLLDLTSSLRAAASFAVGMEPGSPKAPRTGFVYVAGMPHTTGSISYDLDEQLVLARLQSACPPIAKRPHYQDGFLVGRFPINELADAQGNKSSLINRLVAKFRVWDAGSFWTDDPVMSEAALLPLDDPLLERFLIEFGTDAEQSLRSRAFAAAGGPP
jgi:FRG domain-containing protein